MTAQPTNRSYVCTTCDQFSDESFVHYPDSHTWILRDAKTQLIHIHYGAPVVYEALSTEEARWVSNQVLQYYKQYPTISFYGIVSVEKLDNSDFISVDAIRIYEQMLRHEQSSFVSFYGLKNNGLNFILSVLIRITGGKNQGKFFPTLSEAEMHYKKWFDNQAR